MLPQVLPHSWRVHQRSNSEAPQIVGGANPRAQQDRRRVDRPGTEDDLPTIDHLPSLAGADTQTTRAATIQLDAVNQSIADNREVGPTTCRLEVGVIGRDPL